MNESVNVNPPLFSHLCLSVLIYHQMAVLVTFEVLLTIKRDSSINEGFIEGILMHTQVCFLLRLARALLSLETRKGVVERQTDKTQTLSSGSP